MEEITKQNKSNSQEEFQKLLAEDLSNRKFKEGEITTGTISKVGKKYVFVDLGLNSETESRTREIIKKAEDYELTHGKSPSGIVAAALYIAGQETGQARTQREIAEVTNVTEVTIRNRYKQLANNLGIKLEI